MSHDSPSTPEMFAEGFSVNGKVFPGLFAQNKALRRELERANSLHEAASARAYRAEQALKKCQSVLAILTQPELGEGVSNLNAWTLCVAAEAEARAALATGTSDGGYKTSHPKDVCACGDYREQHVDGRGKCRLGSLCTPTPCLKFRLFRPAPHE